MKRDRIERRRFLKGTLGAASLIALAGCDNLTQSAWFPSLLRKAETLTEAANAFPAQTGTVVARFDRRDAALQAVSSIRLSPLQPLALDLLSRVSRHRELAYRAREHLAAVSLADRAGALAAWREALGSGAFRFDYEFVARTEDAPEEAPPAGINATASSGSSWRTRSKTGMASV